MIDLDGLAALLGLPEESVTPLGHRAAIALERRHRPGVRLTGEVLGGGVEVEIRWRERKPGAAAFEEANRATEEGAEALALAVACSRCSWRIERRLQARLAEGADWLMLDPSTGSNVILEIGGADEQDLSALLVRKTEQARRSPFSAVATAAACVVRFLEPRLILWRDDGPRGPEP